MPDITNIVRRLASGDARAAFELIAIINQEVFDQLMNQQTLLNNHAAAPRHMRSATSRNAPSGSTPAQDMDIFRSNGRVMVTAYGNSISVGNDGSVYIDGRPIGICVSEVYAKSIKNGVVHLEGKEC
jgi:hypothetical protein